MRVLAAVGGNHGLPNVPQHGTPKELPAEGMLLRAPGMPRIPIRPLVDPEGATMTAPYWSGDGCACGCDQQPTKGKRFISGHNLRVMVRTPEHGAAISAALARSWKTTNRRKPVGSRRMTPDGYWVIKVSHGRVEWRGEHLLVAESILGRPLSPDEIVHHINGVRHDNRTENLFVCASRAEHSAIHGSLDGLLPELTAQGLVRFDPDERRYVIV